jgi:hypothetical protein
VDVLVGLLDIHTTKLLMQTVEGYAEHKCDSSGCRYGLVTEGVKRKTYHPPLLTALGPSFDVLFKICFLYKIL